MPAEYIAEIVMPTEIECDQIAQQVISGAQALFSSCSLFSGAPLAEEIAARIRKRIQVNVTVIPLHSDQLVHNLNVELPGNRSNEMRCRINPPPRKP